MWQQPYKWDREAREAGERRRVFCASLADWLEDYTDPVRSPDGEAFLRLRSVPRDPAQWERSLDQSFYWAVKLSHLRYRLLYTIYETRNLDWLLLTKRPQNWRMLIQAVGRMIPGESYQKSGFAYWLRAWLSGDRPPSNVWIGTSVENADVMGRIADLGHIPAVCRFISAEPLLGPLDLSKYLRTVIDWVIVGGESGKEARPNFLEWHRSIRDQCQAAGVAFFEKQLGKRHYCGEDMDGMGFRIPLEDVKGGDPAEWPEDIAIRELPTLREWM